MSTLAHNYPNAFHVDILQRVMGIEELNEIHLKYQSGKQRAISKGYVPDRNDISLYRQYLEGEKTVEEVAQLMGLRSNSSVTNRFLVITRLLHNGEITL